MIWRTSLYASFVVVAVLCGEPSTTTTNSEHEEKSDPDKFVPTSEWQKVAKGQPLPAGLHYRLNIYTGDTEVKLLDTSKSSETGDSKTDLLVVESYETDESSTETLYMSKDELKKVLADVTADDAIQETIDSDKQESVKKKFRSYEDLKEEFGSLNLTVKTDMEILGDLVGKAKDIFNTSNDEEDIVTILKDLEYLVHQIDNAREFVRLGGLTNIIIPALNSSSPAVRAKSLWLLGSASQSNPKVQIAVLHAGIMSKLVKASILDSDVTVQARSIYALSCLTRQFPAAQAKLIEEGGLSSFSNIIDNERSSDLKTKIRVITLINDLLLERKYVKKAVEEFEHLDLSKEGDAVKKIQQHKQRELKEKLRQYDAMNLETRIVEDGWCHRLSDFLGKLYESEWNAGRTQRRDDLGSVMSKDLPYRPEHDAIEKVLNTLLVVKNLCSTEFQNDLKLAKVLEFFLSWYKVLSNREEVLRKKALKTECVDSDEKCLQEVDFESALDSSEMYYTTIAESLQTLISFIQRNNISTSGTRDEL
ncbi:nucleotide exchange factor SIL1 [Frankliniella occidentalis]|uniref:Nucleotide exchange factor SIL1 n=1 Tax=Frankliniella occidentalis TaxID=133901 RepID=A0A6J1T387_FRAOC|nr:nucleotide exchange factor SIL1 [Frankliniella occidentalis]